MARAEIYANRYTVYLFLLFSVVVIFNNIVKEYCHFPYTRFTLETSTKRLNESHLRHSSDLYISTCSYAADRRGPHQRVIAYSLYGNISIKDLSKKYLKPLKETIGLIPSIYPGWIVRIYYNLTRADMDTEAWKHFEKTLLLENHVDFCNATKIIQDRKLGDVFAMTWRWLPLLDELVDMFLSRDSDSRIVPREVEAVHEWLTSDRIFHVMRDHPAHCLFGPILGGCWGVKISQNRLQIIRAAENMFTINHQHEYDYDQILLDKHIWPIASNSVMAHDSFCCMIFHPSRPFPTRRTDRLFVAARALLNGKTEELGETDECPQQCRPSINMSSIYTFC